MHNRFTTLLLLVIAPMWVFGQRFVSDSSYVHFYSEAPIENIEAYNIESTSAIDLNSGKLAFVVPISSFEFDKSLMKEHFNENYLESEKFPKATFSGQIDDWEKGVRGEVMAKGEMTIHGVKREITVTGFIENSEDGVIIRTKFPVTLADYKIKIPKAVFYNIAEVVDVTAYFQYKPL
jgi:hypothetical protein